MSNQIRIKRGQSIPTPDILETDGELGYCKDKNSLYINSNNNIKRINEDEISIVEQVVKTFQFQQYGDGVGCFWIK